MPVDWNAHRFSGGALALSAANSIVLRGDPRRRVDRFANANELPHFAAAATGFCADEFGGAAIVVDDPERDHAAVLEVREAIDRLFRQRTATGSLRGDDLARLMSAGAGPLERAGAALSGPRARLPLAAAMALSALSLLPPGFAARIKVCPNCAWLFVDRSRNSARIWCDMAVCGNRAKARRHYRRQGSQEVRP